ncbi:MAG: ABC transporter ATP-binding protein [Candidatus Eisenbacteria bacterium]
MLSLLKGHELELVVCLVLLFTATGVSLLGPILVKRAVDVDIASKNYRGLVLTVIVFVLAQLGFLLLTYVQRVKLETVGQKIISALRERLFAHVTQMSLAYFDKNPVGRLISRVESDTEAMRMLFTSAVVTFAGDVIMFFGMLFVMGYVNPRLMLITAAIVPPILFGAWLFSKKSTPLLLVVRKRTADLTAFLTEHLQGSSIIQIFGREPQVIEGMSDANQRKYAVGLRVELMVVAFFNGLFLMETVGVVLILWRGGMWALEGVVTIGTLMMFMGYVRRFFEPLHRLSEELSTINRAYSGAQRVFDLLDTKPEVEDSRAPIPWKRLQSAITFENIWFSYDKDDWVLRDVSFNLPKGERWALVGATGGGKTSIINLLLRFYEPQRGRILVDGIDIRELTQEELRAKVGLVLQDIFLFPGNIVDNLRMGEKPLTESDITVAAGRIGVDDVLARFPRGLKTELAERGVNLSTGERQLLSFLRALLVDPDILVLDEATSSVDPQTERKLRRAMSELLAGRTSMVIAHRLSTVVDCDNILVIHDGEIVEHGNHHSLIAQGGYYSKLFRLQSLKVIEEAEARVGDGSS